MSRQFKLTLTDNISDVVVFFDVLDTDIAHKWSMEIAEDYTLFETTRFSNWPGGKTTKQFYHELKEQIDIVNNYKPNTITEVDQPVDQQSLNHLHKFFEILRGAVNTPNEFYIDSPDYVKAAINKFNILIHEYEHHMFNHDAMKLTNHPYATIVGTYNCPRYKLEDADYDHYTFQWKFGTVYINYCEVGKPLLDVFKDQDDIIDINNIRPLNYYSADYQIKFGPSTLDAVYKRRVELFDAWYESKKEYFAMLGLQKDKKLALGLIPVAQLNIVNSGFESLTEIDIINFLSKYQRIKKTELCIN